MYCLSAKIHQHEFGKRLLVVEKGSYFIEKGVYSPEKGMYFFEIPIVEIGGG